ncbi:MAG: glycosyltransferase family 4 protein [Planctomycetes bacterium]|nr:glycosyltransferase family 4 protein [Planctomycetota bacterium]
MPQVNLLIISNDVVGASMAGPGIRCYHLARSLAGVAKVRLLTPNECDVEIPGVQIVTWTRRSLKEAFAWADVCLSQGLGVDMYRLLTFHGRHIFDLYDPVHIEELAHGVAETPAEKTPTTPLNVLYQLSMLMKRGDFFVCASERQRDLYLGHLLAEGRMDARLYREDPEYEWLIDVVPYGVPEDEFPRDLPRPEMLAEDDELILWAGGIYNWLDGEGAVRAMPKVLAERPRAKLVFLGTKHPHPGVPEMEGLARAFRAADELGLRNSNVFFLEGWTPYSERLKYLALAKAGLTLHFAGLETRYSYRTRNVDYLYAGVPIVTSAGDEFAEIVASENIGEVCECGNPEDVARKILAVLSSDDRRREIVANIARIRDRWRWSEVAKPIVEYLARYDKTPSRRSALWFRWRFLCYAIKKGWFFFRTGGFRLLLEKLRYKIRG